METADVCEKFSRLFSFSSHWWCYITVSVAVVVVVADVVGGGVGVVAAAAVFLLVVFGAMWK